MTKPRTPADFLKHLQDQDMTVAEWCRENRFSQQLAYRVLNGKTLGRWGEARRITKAMGLKPADMPAKSAPRVTRTASA